METIQVQQNGDVYSCDIGISKEEWLEILKDDKTSQTYKETVLQFFYYPNHRGTCTAVSNDFGGNAQKLSTNVRELGKFVQKRLNRLQVVRPDGTPCFWIIPMCEGKGLPQGAEGTFEWELRPELVEAIREYLYWYLIERYKELRKEIPIDGDRWTELYKWQLITACKGKTPLDIIRSHVANPRKSELGGFDNLIDAARDNKTLIHLIGTNSEGLRKALDTLLDESMSLNERLANYKSSMVSILPATGFNSRANDERTASVILTCVNPEKYTIYKYDVYTLFCKYLGEDKKPTGQCYHHFLELIEPLRKLVTQDKELHQIVAPSLEGQMQSDLLLAQDVLWMLMVEFPEAIGYIRPIMLPTKQRVWLWSGNVQTYLQNSLECGSSAKTIKDFTVYKSKSALRKAYQQDVGNTDLKVPDAYWSFIKEVSVGDIVVVFEAKKGNGKQYHLLHGWGMFTSDCIIVEDDENPMRREIEWHSFLQMPIQNKELLNINTEIEMESKYRKYIDLLETNRNLILTGAPGTGKTYMAKEIAKAMGCTDNEIGFVQFHPSYDYTDFVEGLRPKNDKNGNVGFERRDGVFKEFCKNAIKNRIDMNKAYHKAITKIQNGESEYHGWEYIVKDGMIYAKTKNMEFPILSENLQKIDDAYNKGEIQIEASDIKKLLDLSENGTYYRNFYSQVIPQIVPQSQSVVFVIDEINRGEISKILGELFFSIDPGYRGEFDKDGNDNKVQTQYQNLIPKEGDKDFDSQNADEFRHGFYVPENVYIIGTMNDIDRSVESMDFAMRRRFAWQEVTAEESYANMIENDEDFIEVKDEIRQRMFNLNKAIAETEGLDEAYQIGAAYFRKYLDYQDKENPFECLWENHLKGLLYEYLRGNRRAKELLENLHNAYNKTNVDEQPAHTNEG